MTITLEVLESIQGWLAVGLVAVALVVPIAADGQRFLGLNGCLSVEALLSSIVALLVAGGMCLCLVVLFRTCVASVG
jgi:hypothetical protein